MTGIVRARYTLEFKQEAVKLAGKEYLEPVDLHLPAYRASLPLLEAISREVERLERRKDQILK